MNLYEQIILEWIWIFKQGIWRDEWILQVKNLTNSIREKLNGFFFEEVLYRRLFNCAILNELDEAETNEYIYAKYLKAIRLRKEKKNQDASRRLLEVIQLLVSSKQVYFLIKFKTLGIRFFSLFEISTVELVSIFKAANEFKNGISLCLFVFD